MLLFMTNKLLVLSYGAYSWTFSHHAAASYSLTDHVKKMTTCWAPKYNVNGILFFSAANANL
jgi:hypothetical protein